VRLLASATSSPSSAKPRKCCALVFCCHVKPSIRNPAKFGSKDSVYCKVCLELMLGQIANYCPIISRNPIVKNSTSISSIWQSIRLRYGFQSTGGHFLDFNNIHLEAKERPKASFKVIWRTSCTYVSNQDKYSAY
jgi:hypothetical protein